MFVWVQSLTLYTRKCGHMSTRFEKLVKLSGTNLTQSVYPMITYIQVIVFWFSALLKVKKIVRSFSPALLQSLSETLLLLCHVL